VAVIGTLNEEIDKLEARLQQRVRVCPRFELLTSVVSRKCLYK
jgi:hypothetical protein